MNLQQLLQWRGSGKTGGSLEKYRFQPARRRGASVAAGSDWSLHSTEAGLLEQIASEKPRSGTENRSHCNIASVKLSEVSEVRIW